ncbi:hypothetical protein [Actinomadura sp. 9N407]|uniref:hypothetical protein n=1 Tax=Actinomadura sp. 9N407 TaxID=3375154 RepID=UPI0037AE100D
MADDGTVRAVGELSKALETIERARGHLYSFHQLVGTADFALEDAIDLLVLAGHAGWAEELRTELLGRNVLRGRWTFQVVEEFEDMYYDLFRQMERRVREDLVGGERHPYEAWLKERRRTKGRPGHEASPDE